MAMNVFRLLGDASHVVAVLILLHALFRRQDARGLSRRTQELYLLVFLTRYIDLFTTYYSFYNSCMKVLYCLTSIWTVFALHFPTGQLRHTCVPQEDTFPHWNRLAVPSLIVAFVAHGFGRYIYLLEILWTYSIISESLAMIPQLVLMHQYREWGPDVIRYVFFTWLYRTLYIFNWVYRSYHEPMYQHHYLVYFCGVLQSTIIVVAWVIRRRTPDYGAVDADADGLEYGLLLDDVHDDDVDLEEVGDASSGNGEPCVSENGDESKEVVHETDLGDSQVDISSEHSVRQEPGEASCTAPPMRIV